MAALETALSYEQWYMFHPSEKATSVKRSAIELIRHEWRISDSNQDHFLMREIYSCVWGLIGRMKIPLHGLAPRVPGVRIRCIATYA